MRERWNDLRARPAIGVGRPTPRAVRVIRDGIGPLVRLAFRPTLSGVEHLPRDRPFLLVANHSAGLGVAEILSFAWLYLDRVGPERPLTALAHPEGFRRWPLTAIHLVVGTIPSNYAAASEALAAGVPVLVFPGGDHETLRPIWQANRVDFGGRRGYVRIARAAGVPIVPMAITGSHYTAPILFRADALARWLVVPRYGLGLERWSISLLAILGAVGLLSTALWWPLRVALALLWLATPLTFAPIVPATIRFHVGPPLELDALGDDVDGAGRRVEAALQDIVNSNRA